MEWKDKIRQGSTEEHQSFRARALPISEIHETVLVDSDDMLNNDENWTGGRAVEYCLGSLVWTAGPVF